VILADASGYQRSALPDRALGKARLVRFAPRQQRPDRPLPPLVALRAARAEASAPEPIAKTRFFRFAHPPTLSPLAKDVSAQRLGHIFFIANE
jgi:hypothetical protein